jgi:hypothetical protein
VRGLVTLVRVIDRYVIDGAVNAVGSLGLWAAGLAGLNSKTMRRMRTRDDR